MEGIYNKKGFVEDLVAAFECNDSGMITQFAHDPIRYVVDDHGVEELVSSNRKINVTGNSLTAIAEEFIRLVDGETSPSEVR